MLTDEEFEAERRARTGLSNAIASNKAIRAKAAAEADKQAKDEEAERETNRLAAEKKLRDSYIAAVMSNPAVSKSMALDLWESSGRTDTLKALATKASEREQMARENYKRRLQNCW
jgi:hypothetical protein